MARTTPEFNKNYAMLNPQQKKAVDTIEGPVMVIAGPGTGKTQILTLRIANILKNTDTDPSSILALTFTEAGVMAMRKRLVSMIGPDGYRVGIYTFHGFCNNTIQRFPEDFPRLISSEAITDIDRVLLMRNILDEREHLNILRPFYDNFAHTQAILNGISDLKSEYINPEEFKTLVQKSEEEFFATEDLYNEKGKYKGKMKTKYQKTLKRIEKNKELIEVYEVYEEKMREKKLYDYNDMISEVVKRLQESEETLQKLQEEYQYVLADEHQDANTAQNTLLELLVNFYENPNLFIVGDEKQAIYRFQGASLENFLYFKNKYKKAEVIDLVHSYRSGQKILDTAHSVITSSGEDIKRTALTSGANIQNDLVETREFTSDDLEALWVAQEAEKKINEGVEPNEIAVLYRTNADAAYIARAFERMRVPYTIESNNNVLDDPIIMQLINLLRATSEYGEEGILARALHSGFLAFDPLDIYKLLKYSRRKRIKLYDCLASEEVLKKAGVQNTKELYVFGRRLSKWATAGNNEPVVDVINDIIDTSGFLTFILNSVRSVEMLEKLGGLTRDIEQLAMGNRGYSMSNLIRDLDLMNEHHIRIIKSGSGVKKSGVRLMTAHKSKGLEFDYVYIVGVWDTHWGNTRSRNFFALPISGIDDEQDNADERRLFYVAITRARLGVSVSWSKVSPSGKDRLPSLFVGEMHPEIVEHKETAEFEEKVPKETFLQKLPETKHISINDKEYLQELFVEQGISVTALNNFLKCPWQFFYSNLIRIPKIPNKHLTFGNVVHEALKEFFDMYAKTGKEDKDLLLSSFDNSLAATAISGSLYNEILEKGYTDLGGWYDAHSGSWSQNIKNEYHIETEIDLSLKELSKLKIQGKLDKVDIETDGVTVVDYKTGAVKSRNHILGKTKAEGAGEYFRQLIFYKLLLDMQGIYTMKRGVIDFIQPKENGSYVREKFEVTPQDVDRVIKEIEQMTKSVLALDFWESRCDKHKKGKCEYCALRDVMK